MGTVDIDEKNEIGILYVKFCLTVQNLWAGKVILSDTVQHFCK